MGAYDLSNRLRPAVASLIFADPESRDLHASWALTLWLEAQDAQDTGLRHPPPCHTSDPCLFQGRSYTTLHPFRPGNQYRETSSGGTWYGDAA